MPAVWIRKTAWQCEPRGQDAKMLTNRIVASASDGTMKGLRRSLLTLLLALVISPGCGRGSRATRRGSHAIPFQTLHVEFDVYLARTERTTTLNATGHLERVEIAGKSYGPHDVDPTKQRISLRAGDLSPEQMTELARLWTAADAIEGAPGSAPFVVDGPEIRIERDGVVRFVGGVPSDKLQAFLDRLDALADSLPLVSKPR